MTPEQIITLALGIIGGGGIGAILTAVFTAWINRNKPKIDEADVVSKLHETTVKQLEQMQRDVDRLRTERDAALKEAHESGKERDLEIERHESTKAFNHIIEQRATESSHAAREWHERGLIAEAQIEAMKEEINALHRRVIESNAATAEMGVALIRHQTGPLNSAKP